MRHSSQHEREHVGFARRVLVGASTTARVASLSAGMTCGRGIDERPPSVHVRSGSHESSLSRQRVVATLTPAGEGPHPGTTPRSRPDDGPVPLHRRERDSPLLSGPTERSDVARDGATLREPFVTLE